MRSHCNRDDGDGDQLMTIGGISKGRAGPCSIGTDMQVSTSTCSGISTTLGGQFRK